METRTLFMIGNGFDLAHDLRTSYMDFFNYLRELQSSSSPSYDITPIHYFDNGTVYRLLESPASIAIINILHLDSLNLVNVWHSYFKHIVTQRHPVGSWIDFEKEIEKLVKDMLSPLDPPGPSAEDYIARFKRLMHCSSSFKNYPDKDQLDKMARKMRTDTDPGIAERLCQKVARFLYEELLRYAFCFELYLRFIVPIFSSSPSYPNKPLAELFEPQKQDGQSFLLSFNYTSTVHDRYDPFLPAHYIHGRLRTKEYLQQNMLYSTCQLSTPLVLGFHKKQAEQDDISTPFLFFEKFYQRILHHTDTDIYKWLEDIHNGVALETVVYGHSLDITDEDLIRLIFDRSNKVKIYYHTEDVLPSLLLNLVSIFGRKDVDRSHANGKLEFISAETLTSKKQEPKYATK